MTNNPAMDSSLRPAPKNAGVSQLVTTALLLCAVVAPSAQAVTSVEFEFGGIATAVESSSSLGTSNSIRGASAGSALGGSFTLPDGASSPRLSDTVPGGDADTFSFSPIQNQQDDPGLGARIAWNFGTSNPDSGLAVYPSPFVPTMSVQLVDSPQGDSVTIQVSRNLPLSFTERWSATIELVDPTGTAFPGSGGLTGSYEDALVLLSGLDLNRFAETRGSLTHVSGGIRLTTNQIDFDLTGLIGGIPSAITGPALVSRDFESNLGADGTSWDPSISADGTLVAFSSDATRLITDEQNGTIRDVFLYNRETRVMRNITNGGNGVSEDPVLSKDGQWLAFVSRADNLPTSEPDTNGNIADIVLVELATGEFNLVTAGANGSSSIPSLSRDGRRLAFQSQSTNLAGSNYQPFGCRDDPENPDLPCYSNVMLYDRVSDFTLVLTQGTTSDSRAPTINESGTHVTFIGLRFGGVIAMDIETGDRRRLNFDPNFRQNLDSSRPTISADARWVAINSTPVDNGIALPPTLFVYDLLNDVAHSLGESTQLPGEFSSDERFLVFSSDAENLDGSDPNGTIRDIFRVDLSTPPPFELTRITNNGNAGSGGPVINSDGSVIAWDSTASNFANDNNGELFDVFVLDPVSAASDPGQNPGNGTVNRAPVADSQTLSVNAGSTIDITLTGTDADGDDLSFEIVLGPSGGTLSGVSPNLQFTADSDFSGSSNFFFSASDGSLSSPSEIIFITVVATNSAPLALSQILSTEADTPLAILLSATDSDNDSLRFSLIELPANGTLTGSLPELSYTPASNFTGEDNFTFVASDSSGNSNVASVTISVVAPSDEPPPTPPTPPPPANNTPVANSQTVSTNRETPLTINLTGSDADNDSLAFDFVSLPANGSLSGSAPNLIYTPDQGFSGVDSFAFTARDEQASSAPAVVTISIINERVNLLAAVLPASRSVTVGSTATAFATLINSGTENAIGCSLALPAGLSAGFFYQATDPASNAVIGQSDEPVDIAPGTAQSFIFGITPDMEMAATDVMLVSQCANTTATPSLVGLNTFLLSASPTPVPDLIALSATLTNNGVMRLASGNGFFTAATINVGAAATISVTAETTDPLLPMTLSLCQTDPATSACINPSTPAAGPITVEIAEEATPTFAVFANATAPIALDPANRRVVLRFRDELGEVRGATSVAVEYEP